MKRLSGSILFLLISLWAMAQTSLPRSTPEAEGVSSQSIINFLDAASKSTHEFHSIMIVRHGKVVAEGWWNPYKADLKHTMYSVSKSFTATAVGFAVSEGKLTVEDKVVSFFPDVTPFSISPNLESLKVKHLLSMSVGQPTDPTGKVNATDNWARAFLSTNITNEPGSKFLYNSAATYMLSAIVQKVTGQKIIEYLTPRLFQPLGITGIDWEVDGQGINVGGWGLRLKTEDMAKFGQLFLQKGMWNGKQVLPAAWVDEASTMKIMQNPEATQAQKDSSDWLQGYGYQMWRSRYNSYRGDGAFGQYILVLPEHDAVIAITSETTNMQSQLSMIWKYLLPAFKEKKFSDNKSYRKLQQRLVTLALPVPINQATALNETKVVGKSYTIVSSDRRLKNFTLSFKSGVCKLIFRTDSLDHSFDFGYGKWVRGETTKYGPYLVAGARANRTGLAAFKTEGAYSWISDKTIELKLRYIESPHTEIIQINFDDPYTTLSFRNTFSKQVRELKAIVAVDRANPPKLIVRGDDMGFSHAANQALIKSYREGIQTSIEVIVPSPWFPEAVKILKQSPRADVGLHFAITSEWDNIKWRPLTDCATLKNEDGYFYPMLNKNKNYPGQAVMDHSFKVEDIEKELRAQIEMAKKYIPNLSHVSGHMGSLAFTPEVREMVQKVSKEYNLSMVDTGSIPVSYTGFPFANKTIDERVEGFIAMLDKLEDGKTYVYVEHPGLDNDEMKAINHIGYDDVAKGRQDVTTIFTSEKVKEAIVRKGIKLVSYKEVLGATK